MRIWIAALIGLAACARAAGTAGAPDAPLELDAAIDAPPPIDAPAIDAAPITLVTVAVEATPPSVPAGLTTQMTATGAYSNGTHADLTAMVTWASTADAIATIDASGLVTTHAMGDSMISASLAGTTGSLDLTVAAAAVASIAVGTPAITPLAKGLTVPLVATGTFTDGTTADVTARATWATSDATIATVDPTGVVTAVAGSGSADISATLEAETGKTTIVDAAAQPASLAIASGDIALAQHQAARLHATLTFTDGTTQDVTASAVWSTNAATVVSIAANIAAAQAIVSTAKLSAVSNGLTATITATVGGTACHPVINEVQSAGASAGDEWVELYNPCTDAINVGGWTIDYRAATTVGSQDTNLLATLAGTMQPGELRLYVGPAFSGTATPDGAPWGGANGLLAAASGSIGLRSGTKDTGPLVDAMGYGTITAGNPFVEGAAASALASNKSDARARFDGDDTNSNATDFALSSLPTPKALNNP